MKLLQEDLEEPNEIQRRMLQLIEVHQTREVLVEKAQIYKDKVKFVFDKRTKKNIFQVDDMFLRWDVRRQDRGKHGKFGNLWFGPFRIAEDLGNNAFVLKNLDDEKQVGGPINGCFLNNFFVC